jgi:hypothetical protein
MHDSERQVTHPWLLARQLPNNLDLPPGAEAPRRGDARLALEAAFVELPPTDRHSTSRGQSEDAPAVIIKRKRAVGNRLMPTTLEAK